MQEMTMKTRIQSLVVFLVVFGAFVIAQSVDGKWVGEIQGGRGPQMVTLTLKADGSTLTGTVLGGRGGEVPIMEGTIEKNDLKFKTKQQGRGGEVTFSWSGMLKGDEIAMSRMAEGGQGRNQEFVVKRSN
jgi:hypothetical protein